MFLSCNYAAVWNISIIIYMHSSSYYASNTGSDIVTKSSIKYHALKSNERIIPNPCRSMYHGIVSKTNSITDKDCITLAKA